MIQAQEIEKGIVVNTKLSPSSKTHNYNIVINYTHHFVYRNNKTTVGFSHQFSHLIWCDSHTILVFCGFHTCNSGLSTGNVVGLFHCIWCDSSGVNQLDNY